MDGVDRRDSLDPDFLDEFEDLSEVRSETPCGSCGYQLLGLSRDGNCPECGAPVEESMLKSLHHLIRVQSEDEAESSAAPLRDIFFLIVALIVFGVVVTVLT